LRFWLVAIRFWFDLLALTVRLGILLDLRLAPLTLLVLVRVLNIRLEHLLRHVPRRQEAIGLDPHQPPRDLGEPVQQRRQRADQRVERGRIRRLRAGVEHFVPRGVVRGRGVRVGVVRSHNHGADAGGAEMMQQPLRTLST
jgi:hypothetical protein